MVVSRKIMNVSGFRGISRPQVNNIKKLFIPNPRAWRTRKSSRNTKIPLFLKILHFFDHFGRKHTEQTIFNFTIFVDFDSLILEIWKIHRPNLIP